MALQSSGPISLANVQTEFGGSAPISISEYYGVSYVPTSGTISLSNFYGASSIPDEAESQFIHTNFPGVYLLNGNLGDSNCDFYMYNSEKVAGTVIQSWGLNSVGPGFPQWAGGGSLVNNNPSHWIMIEVSPGVDPNTWDWFHLFYPGGAATDQYWKYSNVTWSYANDNLWYLTAGTLYSYSGGDGDYTNVSGPFPSLSHTFSLYWNGDPNFIDNAATITLANGP